MRTVLTLIVGMALGAVAPAVAGEAWQVLEQTDWLPQEGQPGSFVRPLLGKDQMRVSGTGSEVTYSVKMADGPACTVKVAKNTPITLMTLAPNGETYAATIGPEIKIGWHGPTEAPLPGVIQQ